MGTSPYAQTARPAQVFVLLGLMVGALAVLVVLGTWWLGVLGTTLGSVLALVIGALIRLLPEPVRTSETI